MISFFSSYFEFLKCRNVLEWFLFFFVILDASLNWNYIDLNNGIWMECMYSSWKCMELVCLKLKFVWNLNIWKLEWWMLFGNDCFMAYDETMWMEMKLVWKNGNGSWRLNGNHNELEWDCIECLKNVWSLNVWNCTWFDHLNWMVEDLEIALVYVMIMNM